MGEKSALTKNIAWRSLTIKKVNVGDISLGVWVQLLSFIEVSVGFILHYAHVRLLGVSGSLIL